MMSHKEMTMLKKLTYAMLVSALSLAPSGVFASSLYPAERQVGEAGIPVTSAYNDQATTDQANGGDYRIRLSAGDNNSPFPDQSDSGC